MAKTREHTAHTSGPWQVGTNGDDCAKDHAICADSMVLAKVYGMGYPIGKGSSPESLANARLIAAAPEMLEALKELVCSSAFNGQLFEKDKHSHKWWTLARHAIAKAEGR